MKYWNPVTQQDEPVQGGSGALDVFVTGGGTAYDIMYFTSNTLTDVYTYYLASVLVQTITITYTDTTKAVLFSVAKA